MCVGGGGGGGTGIIIRYVYVGVIAGFYGIYYVQGVSYMYKT